MNKRLITLIACIMAGSFSMAQAQPGGPWGGIGESGDRHERHMEMLQERLNLSDDQAEQIQALIQTGREEMRQLREAHRSKIEAIQIKGKRFGKENQN
ncbi:MAG: periplasmic heavy metal sensor [Gammaproteobacteria bacterium]|nr:periplasmic heavy metal sensor [Gammaproteobacteria bacterium]